MGGQGLRQVWRQVRRPLGRRDLILHLKGWAWVAYGIAVAVNSEGGPFAHPGPPVSALELPDSDAWGWMWIVFGLFSAFSAVASARWNGKITTVGWALSILPPIVWASIYTWTWIVHQIFGCHLGIGWLCLAAFWWLIAWIVRVLAGWDEPTRGPLPAARVQ